MKHFFSLVMANFRPQTRSCALGRIERVSSTASVCPNRQGFGGSFHCDAHKKCWQISLWCIHVCIYRLQLGLKPQLRVSATIRLCYCINVDFVDSVKQTLGGKYSRQIKDDLDLGGMIQITCVVHPVNDQPSG